MKYGGWILKNIGLLLARQDHFLLKAQLWASLEAQWQRIHLPMSETWVQSLIWKDPTCHGATEPVCHNYWACALESGGCDFWAMCHNYWSQCVLEAMLYNKRQHCNEKPLQAIREKSPLSTTRESPYATMKIQHNHLWSSCFCFCYFA